jgi:hypothetical protein
MHYTFLNFLTDEQQQCEAAEEPLHIKDKKNIVFQEVLGF